MKAWKKFWQKNREKKMYIVAAVLCIAVTLCSLCMGSANLTLKELWNALWGGVKAGGATGTIFWYIRLPRTAACLLAGAGLAVAGTVIQSVLANKLASPSIIGVNAGAGLAVTVCCACGVYTGWVLAGSAFLGALLAAFLVAFAAQKINASRTTVILGGVAVNSFLNAVSEAITTLVPEVGVMSGDFRVGGFSSVSYARLLPAGVLIIVALLIVFSLYNELDLMNLGEDMAQGLGLPVKHMRTLFLVLAAMLAGASVSFAGLLGFVGLIVPHTMRKLVGSESGKLLPLSALGGAFFVTLSDLVARTAFSPYEIPVGILMSFIGGPFFIWLLLKRKRGHIRD